MAESFTEIAEVEEQHELRYRKLLANVENGRVFKRDTDGQVALPQLRLHPRRPRSPRRVPGVQAPQATTRLWAKTY